MLHHDLNSTPRTCHAMRISHFAVRIHPKTQANPSSFLTDKKCPFTGLISIRGRILTGTVVSTKMHRTLVIRREYLHFIPKYARYEKRHKNLSAHVSPAFRVSDGDQVTVGQCRPLSKTVRSPTKHTKGLESFAQVEILTH